MVGSGKSSYLYVFTFFHHVNTVVKNITIRTAFFDVVLSAAVAVVFGAHTHTHF